LGEVAGLAESLAASGIDNIAVQLQNQDQLLALLAGESYEKAIQTSLADSGLGLSVDFGSGQVDFLSLHLAEGQIILDVNSASAGTHLSTSLKDLQKLGVDALNVATNVQSVSLDLGSGGFQTQADGHFTKFNSASEIDVTLNASSVQGAMDAADLNNLHSLVSLGIDNLHLDLSNGVNDVTPPGTAANSALISALQTFESTGLDLSINLDAKDLQALQQVNFSFAGSDHVSFDLSSSGAMLQAVDGHDGFLGTGTHLSTSLSDLQKLGVDAVTGLEALGNHVQIDIGSGLIASSLPVFSKAAEVSLNLSNSQDLISITEEMAKALKEAGIDQLSMGWNSQLDGDEEALKAINSLTTAGLGFNLVAPATPVPPLDLSHSTDLDMMLQNTLAHGVKFSNDSDMGDLVRTLFDSGVANAKAMTGSHNVSISDDLASALYESGMITALPTVAGVEITAGTVLQMQTTFKAMAAMGVDKVASEFVGEELLHVNLGASIGELASLLHSFVAEDNNVATQKVFDHAAALYVGEADQNAVDTLQSLLDSGVLDKLHDLGVSQVVAQVVPTAVIPVGAHLEGTNMVFDLDILSKKQ
jgi:hypothetical protein